MIHIAAYRIWGLGGHKDHSRPIWYNRPHGSKGKRRQERSGARGCATATCAASGIACGSGGGRRAGAVRRALLRVYRLGPGACRTLPRRNAPPGRRRRTNARDARPWRHRLPPDLPGLARRPHSEGARGVGGRLVLDALRSAPAVDSARRVPERVLPSARFRRLDNHHAGGAPDRASPQVLLAEMGGSGESCQDGARAEQGVDNLAVSEPRAVRVEFRGNRGGGARVVLARRERAWAGRGGVSSRHGAGAVALPPGPRLRTGCQAPRLRAEADAGMRLHNRGAAGWRALGETRRQPSEEAFPPPVLLRLVHEGARAASRRRTAARRENAARAGRAAN